MDKMALIVPSGSSGPTHRMRVGDTWEHGQNKYSKFFVTIIYPRTLATSTTSDTPGCMQKTTVAAGGDPNLFVYRLDSNIYRHSHLFSADLDEIEAHLAATQVEPGVSYFNTRRELWLNGKKTIPRPDEIPDSITKLEDMVRDPEALRSSSVWEAGLGRISKRLIEGGRLKYNLPMHLLVCNTPRLAMHLVLTRSSFSDKNTVCRLDSRWNVAAGGPSPRVR